VAAEAQAAALAKKQISETVTLGVAWSEYLDARKPFWSERHYDDQLKQHISEASRESEGKN